jgi:hypothetical protein
MARASGLTAWLRPTVVIRRRAIYKGILGNSRFWRTVAIVMVGTQTFRRLFGRNPEVVEVVRLKGGGHLMQIATYDKPSRRERRRGAA